MAKMRTPNPQSSASGCVGSRKEGTTAAAT